MSNWIPLFVLPNIRVKDGVSIDEAAIVPNDEPRVRAYVRDHGDFGMFIKKFTDPFGAKSGPGVMLLRNEVANTFRTMEAVSSFRDLIALSVIPLQRARSLARGGSFYIQYSDYFDFYPWTFHEGHGHLVCNTPGLVALHEVSAFKGQSSPILSPLDLDSFDLDAPLLRELLIRWQKRYGSAKPAWAEEALFRSLNMAVAASKMPAGPDLTRFALGRNLGLWVSAFEILIHKGTDKIRLWDVYDQLTSLPWGSKKSRYRRYRPYGLKDKRRNLACWIYGEIHHARNDFLHGNPIDPQRLLVKRSGRNLFLYAAPLYRMALTGFLQPPQAAPPSGSPTQFSRDRFDLIVNQHDVEEALYTVLVSEEEYRAQRAAEQARVRITSRRGSNPPEGQSAG